MCKTAIMLTALLFGLQAPLAAAQDEIGSAHLTIENPSSLPPADIEKIYESLRERMAQGYALSKLPGIADYQSWRRYNNAPYLSATHGQRFVSNYANKAGESYGTLADGESHPVGTVLAKDAMTVTEDEKQFPGALFLMEKLQPDTSPATGDWRYFVVNPDGSLFGDTTGDEPQLVEYCHACHEAKADQDYVFYIPEAYRKKP